MLCTNRSLLRVSPPAVRCLKRRPPSAFIPSSIFSPRPSCTFSSRARKAASSRHEPPPAASLNRPSTVFPVAPRNSCMATARAPLWTSSSLNILRCTRVRPVFTAAASFWPCPFSFAASSSSSAVRFLRKLCNSASSSSAAPSAANAFSCSASASRAAVARAVAASASSRISCSFAAGSGLLVGSFPGSFLRAASAAASSLLAVASEARASARLSSTSAFFAFSVSCLISSSTFFWRAMTVDFSMAAMPRSRENLSKGTPPALPPSLAMMRSSTSLPSSKSYTAFEKAFTSFRLSRLSLSRSCVANCTRWSSSFFSATALRRDRSFSALIFASEALSALLHSESFAWCGFTPTLFL
mmetsp:Transcript_52175/g.134584  ORF Transcript_52175/g.134584 Transcript_52175/m.134584 type:complete len:356 (-) Transcript_52175:863-1930(-)